MADQQLLSDLCSICHVNSPKYKCPRCSTRTCSLECVKRHKKRADCSGERDATSFVKKAQLYTPAGVDHDFNFIRGIERKADDAERLFREITDDPWHTDRKRQHALANALRRSGVRVKSAPTGMSRQRENRTRWAPGSRRIFWTVEWINEDGSRHLDDVSEHASLCVAYSWQLRRERGILSAGQLRNKRRKLAHEAGKRVEEGITDSVDSRADTHQIVEGSIKIEDGDATEPITLEAEPVKEQSITECENYDQADTECTAVEEDPPVAQTERGTGEVKSESDEVPTKIDDVSESLATAVNDEDAVVPKTTSPKAEGLKELPPGSPDPTGLHYYLIKPRVTIRETVLIPLSPTASLSQSLRGQTILEYPSIQVLPHGPAALPQGFMLEETYLAKAVKQEHEMRELLLAVEEEQKPGPSVRGGRRTPREVAVKTEGEEKPRSIPNSNDMMAILQRDILG